MKPGKHQRSKQICQDLCWRVHDPAQSFVLRSYTMHELCNQTCFYWLVPQYGVNNYCVLCMVEAKKVNKSIQQRTLLGFKTIPLYYLWFISVFDYNIQRYMFFLYYMYNLCNINFSCSIFWTKEVASKWFAESRQI